MKLQERLGALKKPSYTAIISILLAIIVWFVVVNTIADEGKWPISDVVVPINTSSPTLNSLGLSVIEGENPKVTVLVEGRRAEVNNLKPEDIRIQASFAEVDGAGTFNLKLEAVSTTAGQVISISPPTVTVKFDRELKKELPVIPDINGLSVPEKDYILGSVSVNPSYVTVKGPEKEIERITKAVVTADIGEPLVKSQVISSSIRFVDNEGTEVVSNHIVSDFSSVDITIPVKRKVELPLTLSFINVPDGFPLEELKYTLSNDTIMVAAQESSIKKTTEIIAGVINFEDLDLTEESTYTFKVKLPEDFVNVNNIETVVVEFDTTGLASETLNLNEFVVRNQPAGFLVQSTTLALNNVKIVGSEAVLKGIKAGDFVVEIDLSDREVQLGQYEMPVNISAPTKGLVWAVGPHTVVINVQAKTKK